MSSYVPIRYCFSLILMLTIHQTTEKENMFIKVKLTAFN